MNLSEKYRPTTLDDFIGNDGPVRTLGGLFAANIAPSAVIIQGPTGSGKTTLARILGRALNVDVDAGVNGMDWREIPARGCKTDTVRDLARDMRFFAWNPGGWKVYFVDEAHTMSKAAVQAWLSVLESIPEKRLVVFATMDSRFEAESAFWHRCHTIRLAGPTERQLADRLRHVGHAEGLNGEVDYAALAAQADGSYRKALGLLAEQIAAHLVGQ